MIGICTKLCVAEMAMGQPDPSEVEVIISGEKFSTPERIKMFIKYCRRHEWRDSPDRCEAIFRELLAAGKIQQPRLEGKNAPKVTHNHWVNHPDQVVYHN